MPRRVRERLLEDPVRRLIARQRHLPRPAGARDRDREPGGALLGEQRVERGETRGRLDRPGEQFTTCETN